MNISTDTILIIILALALLDFVLACRIVISKLKREDSEDSYIKLKSKLIKGWINGNHIKKIRPFFNVFSEARHIIKLDDETEDIISEKLANDRLIRNSFKRINSLNKIKRIESAINLSLLGTPNAVIILGDALLKEKNISAKLYIANALSDIKNPDSIPVLISSLIGEKKWYREKVNLMIADYGIDIQPYINELFKRDELEIHDLLVDMTFAAPSESLKAFIFDLIDHCSENRTNLQTAVAEYKEKKLYEKLIWDRKTDLIKEHDTCEINLSHMDKFRNISANTYSINTIVKEFDRIIAKAADVAIKYFFMDFATEKYLTHSNIIIRHKSAYALSKIRGIDSIHKLVDILKNRECEKSAQIALSEIIRDNPEYIDDIASMMIEEKNKNIKRNLAASLSGKIEYFIMKMPTLESSYASKVIKQILLLGKTSEFIGFMNNNTNLDIENSLIKILKQVIKEREELIPEFSMYLNDKLLEKAELEKLERPKADKRFALKPDLIKTMYIVMIVILLFFPLLYVARHIDFFGMWPLLKHIRVYIVDFNYFLVFYSLVINLLYLFIIILSRINITKQVRISKLKNDRMLFKKRMLPGISIIAPAFNEENIIIDSTNSLLNLKYPDYNLIIVNDGSTDNTLKSLIDYYELDRTDYSYDIELSVAPIRGIYTNPAYPKLLVVDTENAGKADSLNSGIIISDKEYICCIDADSLLENDALLKLSSQTLDECVETPALGGNVFPINGCEVSRGYISDKKIPKKLLAKFQTMEYMRSFLAGRMGWAHINCLLIISGAFGLFRRERVIKVGGFLTQKSKYHKDTVGEDMELVVRISQLMHEEKKPYRINYCFNANCWTEVPEDWVQLRRQRVRWYTGLVETLHFHKKTIFNPTFGKMGLIGMPYYFLFEMVGPLIEVQGYLMILMAIIFGILSAKIALLLFLASVMLGILVSMVSLLIGESKSSFYDYKDVVKLIGIAVLENLGPRQIFSFWRVVAYIKMMFSKEHTWGEQKRKGFDK